MTQSSFAARSTRFSNAREFVRISPNYVDHEGKLPSYEQPPRPAFEPPVWSAVGNTTAALTIDEKIAMLRQQLRRRRPTCVRSSSGKDPARTARRRGVYARRPPTHTTAAIPGIPAAANSAWALNIL